MKSILVFCNNSEMYNGRYNCIFNFKNLNLKMKKNLYKYVILHKKNRKIILIEVKTLKYL